MSDERRTVTLKVTDRQFQSMKRKMAIEGLTWQKVLNAAVNAYLLGDMEVMASGKYRTRTPRNTMPQLYDETDAEVIDINDLRSRGKGGRTDTVHTTGRGMQRKKGRRLTGWGVPELAVWLRETTGRRVQLQKLRKLLRKMEVPKEENGRWRFEGEDDEWVGKVREAVENGELDQFTLDGYKGER